MRKEEMTIDEKLDHLENRLSVLNTVYVDDNTKSIKGLNEKINLILDHFNIKIESGDHIVQKK